MAPSTPDNEEAPVIIVGGTFELDPPQRDAFLAERHDMMRTSRTEDGCLEYTFAADPLEPGRVILFERWGSQAPRRSPGGDLGDDDRDAALRFDHALRRGW